MKHRICSIENSDSVFVHIHASFIGLHHGVIVYGVLDLSCAFSFQVKKPEFLPEFASVSRWDFIALLACNLLLLIECGVLV
jgi:hypothetical protein